MQKGRVAHVIVAPGSPPGRFRVAVACAGAALWATTALGQGTGQPSAAVQPDNLLRNPDFLFDRQHAVAVVGASWANRTATYTLALPRGSTLSFPAGSSITISGMAPAGYNVTAPVTASTSTSVSVAIPDNPGSAATFGAIHGATVPVGSGAAYPNSSCGSGSDTEGPEGWHVSNVFQTGQKINAAQWRAGVAYYTLDRTIDVPPGSQVSVTGMAPFGYDVVRGKVLSNAGGVVGVAMAADPGAATRTGFLYGGPCNKEGLVTAAPPRLTLQQIPGPPGHPAAVRVTVVEGSPNTTHQSSAQLYQYVPQERIWGLAEGTPQAQPLTVSALLRSSVAGNFALNAQSVSGIRMGYGMCSVPVANVWTPCTLTMPGDNWSSGSKSCTGSAPFTPDQTWRPGPFQPALAVAVEAEIGTDFQGDVASNPADLTYGPAIWGCFASGDHRQTQLTTITGATLDIAAVKAEVGAAATPFVARPSAEELATLDQFFEDSNALAAPGTPVEPGRWIFGGAGSVVTATMRFRTRMNATPKMTFWSPVTGAVGYARDYTNKADVRVEVNQASPEAVTISVNPKPGSKGGDATTFGVGWSAEARM